MRYAHLLFLAFTAVFIALLIQPAVETAIAPLPALRPDLPLPAETPSTQLHGGRLHQQLGLRDRPVVPVPVSLEPLHVKLLGTLIGDEDDSAASVYLVDLQRVITVRPGDQLLDGEVLEIKPRFLRVLRQGQLEIIRSEFSSQPPAARQSVSSSELLRRESDNTFTVSRADLERQMTTLLDGLMKGCHLIPAFVNGKPVGFKIFSIKPGSLYQQLGFENGDVLTQINGVPLDANGLMALSAQLMRPSKIEVDATRNGVARTTRINIF